MWKFCIRILGVLRFLYYKFLLGKDLRTKGLYVVEKGAQFRTRKRGTIQIGRKAHLFAYTKLQSNRRLIIGNHLSINSYSRIIALENIEIGDHVTIAQFVSILDHDHAYEFKDNTMKLYNYNTSPIYIGSNVLVGDKVTILKGVKIGDNVIIGANSLINKDIPNNCIVVGNPGKIVKRLIN